MAVHMFCVPNEKDLMGRWIYSRRRIFKKYLKTAFIVDLVPFFPFYLIHPILLGVEFLRFWKLYHLANMLKRVLYRAISFLYKNRASKVLTVYNTSANLLTFVVWFALLTHVLSNLFILVTRLSSGDEDWLQNFDEEGQKRKIYLESTSFVLTTLTTLGDTKLPLMSSLQQLTSILYGFIGTLMVSYAVTTTTFVHKKSISILPLVEIVSLPISCLIVDCGCLFLVRKRNWRSLWLGWSD